MWGYLLLGVSIGLISLCMGARWSMRFAWRKRKEELEELNRELEQMDELTETLIEDLLKNEFFDYDALFKNKKNID